MAASCDQVGTSKRAAGGNDTRNVPASLLGTAVTAAVTTPVRGRSNKYALLTLLTVSILVFSLPDDINLLIGSSSTNFWNPEIFEVTSLLFACQSVVDPFIFVLTTDKVRFSGWRR
ncbi:hypothetical protein BV898_12199 [Hypsibius exemplaris]|uniref:G-protein coupled receptors family 1 profile domain-containing protein n=1 Tax=Hypsibius exemplaris TaxID=2072580 RepID=A0A1W0WEF8_HYPEX|nr:hypothetical protein BV898_12199 [Hypsibius exemplaris]